MLKQVKTAGRILNTTTTADLESVTATVEVEGKQEVYIVMAITPSEEYSVRKGTTARYTVNLWNNTCECEGYNRGFNCRHIRMTKALRTAGKVK